MTGFLEYVQFVLAPQMITGLTLGVAVVLVALGLTIIFGQLDVIRYYNRPDETSKAIEDGWIRTGDVAKADEDGYLYIVDRKKDMVLSGGFDIYTKEVEQTLLQNPDVADPAVVGVPDAVFGEAVAAFIEREQGTAPTRPRLSNTSANWSLVTRSRSMSSS
jgi:acyl-CoA synthetase (AMP-forming)/AMP-acid ligase II